MTPWTGFDVIAVDAETAAAVHAGEAELLAECERLGLVVEYFGTSDSGRTRLYRVLHDANT